VELDIVTVLESQDPVEVAWAKAALDEAGILFYVAGEEIGVLSEAISPFLTSLCRIQVASDRAAEALSILEPLKEIEAEGAGDQR
jgi:hypothetical protein